MVTMTDVDSSNIEAIGYDGELRELHVRFKRSETVYIYDGVPEAVYLDLKQSESKGAFIRAHIANQFGFRKA